MVVNTATEASYSRLITKLEETNVLERVQEKVVEQPLKASSWTKPLPLMQRTLARDQAPLKEENPVSVSKNVGVNQRQNIGMTARPFTGLELS